MHSELLRTLLQVLAELPGVDIEAAQTEVPDDGVRWDAVVAGRVKGQLVQFCVEVRSGGYPRDMQQAIWRVAHADTAHTTPYAIPIVVAPAISATSRDLLRAHGVAYADAGGSVYIDLPWAFYWVDRPAPAATQRSVRNVYRGSAAQVLHALLLEADRAWHVSALAERAQVSVSTAHQVCRFLEDQLWMEQQGKGPRSVRLLREPGKALEAWANVHALNAYSAQRFYRWTRDPAELTRTVTMLLDNAGIDYALTLSSGAQFVAPHVTDLERLWVLVPKAALPHVDALVQQHALEPVEDGEVITLFVTDERAPFLFRQQVQGSWVASDVQLYLDLSAWPRRGKEQAKHLRAERLTY